MCTLSIGFCVASLQERHGSQRMIHISARCDSPKIISLSVKTFLYFQLGLMDLLELSKGHSKIGAKAFQGLCFKLLTSKSPSDVLSNSWVDSYRGFKKSAKMLCFVALYRKFDLVTSPLISRSAVLPRP